MSISGINSVVINSVRNTATAVVKPDSEATESASTEQTEKTKNPMAEAREMSKSVTPNLGQNLDAKI